MDIKDRLILLRAARKLTQTDVATALGISLSTYVKREADPKSFTQDEIETLKSLLGVGYEDIFLPKITS